MIIKKIKRGHYGISFGSFTGIDFRCKRKVPNYVEFDTYNQIVIGKMVIDKNPIFNKSKTTYWIFFFLKVFRVEYADKS